MEHVLPRRGYTRSRDRVCAEECSCRAVRESHGRSTFQGVPSRPAGLEWRSERVTSSFFLFHELLELLPCSHDGSKRSLPIDTRGREGEALGVASAGALSWSPRHLLRFRGLPGCRPRE